MSVYSHHDRSRRDALQEAARRALLAVRELAVRAEIRAAAREGRDADMDYPSYWPQPYESPRPLLVRAVTLAWPTYSAAVQAQDEYHRRRYDEMSAALAALPDAE